jgi:IS605 OrfB family transposase
VKLTAQVKLLPSTEQAASLKKTLATVNAACNFVADVAWKERIFSRFSLQRLVYRDVRDRFALTAQLTVHAIAKVADAYKIDRKTRRTFKAIGSIDYDSRILRWFLAKSVISIWTLSGRQRISFVCGERQHVLLQTQQGESALALVRGKWYLFATCNIDIPEAGDITGMLGVDLGIINIATDSDGTIYSAAVINGLRHRHRRLRRKLQMKQTKGAFRRLRKISGKEKRFATHTNHCISKCIVTKAKRTKRGIALEDLKGILARVRARRPQRATLHSWSFAQLGSFVGYKAALAGVPVIYVDSRHTSQRCPGCGHVSAANRQSQRSFLCIQCGLAGLADAVAAANISAAGLLVNQPYCL